MSYCRWTRDSDVYCYQSANGFVVWTAKRQARSRFTYWLARKITKLIGWTPAWRIDWLGRWLDWIEFKTIDLPPGDKCCESEQECLDHLNYLRSVGYRVPEYALERLKQEMCET